MTAREVVRLMNEEEHVVFRALQGAEVELAEAAEKAAEAFQVGGRVVYLGSGTSGRVAAGDCAEMPPTFGISADRFIAIVSGGTQANTRAIENAEDDRSASIEALNQLHLDKRDIVIGLSASGSTPFVLSGLRHAAQKGIWTCGIVNNPNSPIKEAVSLHILLDTGPEVLTGSTRLKAGTAQKLALNRISTAAMVLSDKVVENLMIDVRASNAKLKDRCVRILRDLSTLNDEEALALLEETGWSIRKALNQTPAHAGTGQR